MQAGGKERMSKSMLKAKAKRPIGVRAKAKALKPKAKRLTIKERRIAKMKKAHGSRPDIVIFDPVNQPRRTKCGFMHSGTHLMIACLADQHGWCDRCAVSNEYTIVAKNDSVLVCKNLNCNIYVCSKHFEEKDGCIVLTDQVQ